MTLAATTDALWRRLNELRDSVRLLTLTVAEDRPRHSDFQPVDTLAEGALEVLDLVQESMEAAADAISTGHAEPVPERLRRALAVVQDRVDQVGLRVGFDLGSHRRLTDLDELAADRGREWHAWTASVLSVLEHCQPSLRAAQQALLACWLELTEPSPAAAGPPSTRPAGAA
jgi:hypothetical protein